VFGLLFLPPQVLPASLFDQICDNVLTATTSLLHFFQACVDMAQYGHVFFTKRRFEFQLAGALQIQLKSSQRPALALAERVFCCSVSELPPI
jgi:hypothetical protein